MFSFGVTQLSPFMTEVNISVHVAPYHILCAVTVSPGIQAVLYCHMIPTVHLHEHACIVHQLNIAS